MAWIPEPIYSKLPVLYVGVGCALLAVFGFSGPGTISALMFFAAAGTTLLWRYTHRQAAIPEPPDPRDEWAKRRAARIIGTQDHP